MNIIIMNMLNNALRKAGVNINSCTQNDDNSINVVFSIPLTAAQFELYNKEDREYLTNFIEDELYASVYSMDGVEDYNPDYAEELQAKLEQLLGRENEDNFNGELEFFAHKVNLSFAENSAIVKCTLDFPRILDPEQLQNDSVAINANPSTFRNLLFTAIKYGVNNFAKACAKITHFEFDRLFSNH